MAAGSHVRLLRLRAHRYVSGHTLVPRRVQERLRHRDPLCRGKREPCPLIRALGFQFGDALLKGFVLGLDGAEPNDEVGDLRGVRP